MWSGTSNAIRDHQDTDKQNNRAARADTSAHIDESATQLSTTRMDEQNDNGRQCCVGDGKCSRDRCRDWCVKGQDNCEKPCKCAGDHNPTPCGDCGSDYTCPLHRSLRGDRRWSDNMWRLFPGPRLERYVLKDVDSGDRASPPPRVRSSPPQDADYHQSYRDHIHDYPPWSCQSSRPPVQAMESLQARRKNSMDKLLDSLHLSKDVPSPPKSPIVVPVYRFNFSWRCRSRPGESSRWNRLPFSRSRSPAIQEVEPSNMDGNDEPTESELVFQSATIRKDC
ncbi:hypothetical protein PMIN01_10939 [Paraphaeosphaeria minitans]|uniref:Uncharacterized protein n=1 Tax=Paraphaeosphaeria minitans TaxID=565426 RepID=A0A9P6G9A2_9PLEO|nr:hypothetical protein PMIN01_10939 [Paraphaeosphaeria minitans]